MTDGSRRLLLSLFVLLLGVQLALVLGGRHSFELRSDVGPPPTELPAIGEGDSSTSTGRPDFHEQLEQLRALGYVGEADSDLDRTSVVLHDVDRAGPGANLYNPAHSAELEGEKFWVVDFAPKTASGSTA